MMPTLKISSEQEGKRLDVILARLYPDYSRSFLQKWIRDGQVTSRGQELIPNYRVHAGETIDVKNFDAVSPDFQGPSATDSGLGGYSKGWTPRTHEKSGPLSPKAPVPSVLYEDDTILVLNKPANLVVHPAPSHKGSTLVDWLAHYLGKKVTGLFADSSRLGVVHRLDKDTTGVLLVAKTVLAQNKISKQFQDRIVKKTYVAFVEGTPKARRGVITAPVGRSQNVPSRMAVSSTGRPSETSFEVVESYQEVSQLNLHPKTGRTHQIRVHCAAIGHPIVGDHTYGSHARWEKDYGISRPLLHAEKIEFLHPTTRRKVTFKAPWPADMRKALALFRKSAKTILVLVCLTAGVQVARCEGGDEAPPAKHKAASASTSTASSTKALKKEMASIREQFKSLIEEFSALQDRVTGIQSSLDELGASRRLHDLEKAISDLNGKSVNTANITEESKSQVLDLSRKVKAQQEVLDQLRDQMDHLQREVIQTKAREDVSPPDSGVAK